MSRLWWRRSADSQARPPEAAGPPVVAGPIVAYRVWGVVTYYPGRGHWFLSSLGYGQLWIPGTPQKAQCRAGRGEHPAPRLTCLCGFWAFKDAERALEAAGGDESYRVMGSVGLWGRVIECEYGYRAAFAYPVELFSVYSLIGIPGFPRPARAAATVLRELAAMYGVPWRQ